MEVRLWESKYVIASKFSHMAMWLLAKFYLTLLKKPIRDLWFFMQKTKMLKSEGYFFLALKPSTQEGREDSLHEGFILL